MEEQDGFQITRGAVQVQEGFVPVIEAQGNGLSIRIDG